MATTELWVLSLRDRDRDPMNRDIDNEAQGLAAQAARPSSRSSAANRRRGAPPPRCASTGAVLRGGRDSSPCRATPSAA